MSQNYMIVLQWRFHNIIVYYFSQHKKEKKRLLRDHNGGPSIRIFSIVAEKDKCHGKRSGCFVGLCHGINLCL